MPWMAAPPTKNGKIASYCVGCIEQFFFQNRIKNPHLFFKGDGLWNRKNRVITRHAFPARGLKNGGATRFGKKKRKKNQKSRDFQDISKISGMNVRRLDTYPEKNHRDFRTVIFGTKKLNSSFFDICKKTRDWPDAVSLANKIVEMWFRLEAELNELSI